MRFDYIKARTLTEASELLVKDPQAHLLAGGTDILVEIQEGRANPSLLVDIGGIPELNEIKRDGDTIIIGALVTHARVASDPALAHQARPLALGCAEVGSPQIRNRGTIGGNVANASPAADAIPGLLALGASVKLFGPQGERELPLEEFILGVKKTALLPGELLVSVSFEALGGDEGGFFLKLGQRKALAIAKVSAAGRIGFEGSQISAARIVLGAVAITAIRASAAEQYLLGKRLSPDTIEQAGKLASEESKAISDIRSQAGYRDEMAGVLVSRGLDEILNQSCSFSC